VSLGTGRLRTFLAMLGIVIGVAAVVLLLAIGAGSRRAVEESIGQLGTNLLMVTPGMTDNKGVRSAGISRFTTQDADAVALLPPVLAAAPATLPRPFQAAAGKFNWNTQVTGTTPSFFGIRNWVFADGEAFSGEDVRLARRVAVIGATVAGKLFPQELQQGGSVVDRILHINGVPFRVAGVLQAKGAGFDGRDQDDAVFIPITTAKIALWGQGDAAGMVQVILVQAASADALDEASEDIISLLRQRHRVPENAGNNATIRNFTAIAAVAADATQALSLLLGAVASISLFVGGIGIMNIMLVNVSERTREIGIRKALGATNAHILLQFLLEAVMIAGVGSLTGLALAILGGLAAEHWLRLNVEFSLWSMWLALGIAGLTGLASGLYPAWKAAALPPIEALRAVG
jgi:putative ABC transport system permease protein